MTDPRDLEANLAEMDSKLRELQRELALLSRPSEGEPEREPDPEPELELEPEPEPEPPGPSAVPVSAIEQAAARVAELGRRIDGLTDLRNELDRASRALREEQRRSTSSEPSQ
jgi:hypothetical protein